MADEAYQEQQKYIRRIVLFILLALLAGYVTAFLVLPIESWVRVGLDMETLGKSVAFWKKAALNPLVLAQGYARWWKGFTSAASVPFSFYLPWLPLLVTVAIFIIGMITNPYHYMPNIFGSGRLATLADVKKMGLLNGFVCV